MRRRREQLSKSPPLRTTGVVLVIFAALFVAMRLFTAWLLRSEVNGDLAIVQMMVRDMASGGPIPAFFYGQAYMGSLEPIANTIFHILFGRTDFGTELGTALFAVLSAVAVVRMARRTGGEWAAVAALALLVVGPTPFAHYAVSPRGGYGVLLFTTAWLLDIGTQLIVEERRDGRCRHALCIVAGLLAGIGFWCNQLVFPAVAAVTVGIALFAPRLLRRARLWLGGIIGFAVGSAPFWIWNARNGWESFQMSGSLVFDRVAVCRNVLALAAGRWPMLFDAAAPHAPRAAALAVVVASLILPALALRAFAPLPRRIHPDERPLPKGAKEQLAVIVIFLAAFLGCYVCSHFAVFATPRYLLPTVPALAVLAGAACSSTRFRSANMLAVALLVFLVGWQVRAFAGLVARGCGDAARKAGYREAVEYLEGKGTDVAYCSFRHNSLNLCGNVAFTDNALERVPALRRRAELADSPAIVEDFRGIARWAVASGGSLCATNIGGLRVATDVVPPSAAVAELPLDPERVSARGGKCLPELIDRNYATSLIPKEDWCYIDIDLGDEPKAVCGVRILASGLGPVADLTILASYARGEGGRPVAGLQGVPARWSGPRFYPEPECQILECRFRTRRLARVSVSLYVGETGVLPQIREVQVLTPTSAKSPATPAEWHAAVDGLVDVLHRHGVNRLYASRWIANAVVEKTRGAIWTNHGQDLHPKPTGAPKTPARSEPLAIDGFTALLVSPSGATAMRIALHKSWIKMREVHAGSLGVLFIPESIQVFPWGDGEALGLLFDPDCPTFFPSAEWEERVINTPPNDTAVTWTQDYPPTIPWLRYALEHKLTDSRAAELRQALDLLSEPTLGDEARFADLHTWRGVRVLAGGDAMACPGGTVCLRHYWSSPRGALPDGRSYRVFVHFIGPDGYRFLDGFPLDVPPEGPDTTGSRDDVRFSSLSGEPFYVGDAPHDDGIWGDVLWHVDRRVTIPKDAPTGIYEMHLGLLDANFYSKRMPVDTRLPRRRRAIIVNPVLAVSSSNDKETHP